jgi:hypothetical protein
MPPFVMVTSFPDSKYIFEYEIPSIPSHSLTLQVKAIILDSDGNVADGASVFPPILEVFSSNTRS